MVAGAQSEISWMVLGVGTNPQKYHSMGDSNFIIGKL
jgi:hypothetical protein